MVKKNIWDRLRRRKLKRPDSLREDGSMVTLEGGVNYFVLMLEQLGCTTIFTCEGHPDGFYILFQGEYHVALMIKQAGYFSVEIEGPRAWSIRFREEGHAFHNGKPKVVPYTYKHRARHQRWAAQAWEETLGPLEL